VIVDSSALLAILRAEPEAQEFADRIQAAEHPKVSAASLLETAMVAGWDRRGSLDDLIQRSGATVVAFDGEQANLAREAFYRFGTRSGSDARLNFGDCMTYALAKVTGEPLLFKGDDFTHTDIESALS
jgi:ribonuclease VapC